jgi:hypothetical protein
VVTGTVDASDSVWALVKDVVTSCGSTVVARWWWLQVRLRRIVWGYLDGGNRVGKIPS